LLYFTAPANRRVRSKPLVSLDFLFNVGADRVGIYRKMAKKNAAVFWEPSLVKQALRVSGHNRIDTYRLTAPGSEWAGAWISDVK
jgi:hypothetical protein